MKVYSEKIHSLRLLQCSFPHYLFMIGKKPFNSESRFPPIPYIPYGFADRKHFQQLIRARYQQLAR